VRDRFQRLRHVVGGVCVLTTHELDVTESVDDGSEPNGRAMWGQKGLRTMEDSRRLFECARGRERVGELEQCGTERDLVACQFAELPALLREPKRPGVSEPDRKIGSPA